MDSNELQQQIWEHADGRPASAELERALAEQPELRAELELARKHAASLRQALGAARPSEADLAILHAQIIAQLPAKSRYQWRVVVAAAASILLAAAVLGAYEFVFRADTTPENSVAFNAAPAPAATHRQWRVERFSPSASESIDAPMRTEQNLTTGDTLRLGQQEYAKVSEAQTGATWLAYPGTELTAGESLELEQGTVELQVAQKDSADVIAAGRKYSSRANFSVSVEGPATLLCVYSGTVTRTVGNESEALGLGYHALGGEIPAGRTQACADYVKGFEAWSDKDYATARKLFGAAAQAPEIEATSRRYAHFYWFAAAGCDGDQAEAVRIGEAYVSGYPAHATVPYVRLFLGIYLVEMGDHARGKAHLAAVVATDSGQLGELAKDRLEGGEAARAQVLWQAYYVDWQRQDYTDCEQSLLALLRDCPEDESVTSGEAQFRLFGAVGNQGRLEDALKLADDLLVLPAAQRFADYVLYFKAYYLSQLGRTDAALETIGRLEKDCPESPMLKFALPLRDELQTRK